MVTKCTPPKTKADGVTHRQAMLSRGSKGHQEWGRHPGSRTAAGQSASNVPASQSAAPCTGIRWLLPELGLQPPATCPSLGSDSRWLPSASSRPLHQRLSPCIQHRVPPLFWVSGDASSSPSGHCATKGLHRLPGPSCHLSGLMHSLFLSYISGIEIWAFPPREALRALGAVSFALLQGCVEAANGSAQEAPSFKMVAPIAWPWALPPLSAIH